MHQSSERYKAVALLAKFSTIFVDGQECSALLAVILRGSYLASFLEASFCFHLILVFISLTVVEIWHRPLLVLKVAIAS